jgi:hypothetical protein
MLRLPAAALLACVTISGGAAAQTIGTTSNATTGQFQTTTGTFASTTNGALSADRRTGGTAGTGLTPAETAVQGAIPPAVTADPSFRRPTSSFNTGTTGTGTAGTTGTTGLSITGTTGSGTTGSGTTGLDTSGAASDLGGAITAGVTDLGVSSPGSTVFLSGFGGPSPDAAILRITNAGATAGRVTVRLFDAATGAELGTAVPPDLPAWSSIEMGGSVLLGGVSPPLSAVQRARPFNVLITPTFTAQVQQLSRTATGVSNATACAGGTTASSQVLGHVEGPGASELSGVIRIINLGTTVGQVRLALRNGATGVQLSTWTSPTIPARGEVSVTTASLAVLRATTTVVNLTTACRAGR